MLLVNTPGNFASSLILFALSFQVPTPTPEIHATPTGEVVIGTNVTLQCRVNKAEPGAMLRWSRGQWEDVPVEDGNFYQVRIWSYRNLFQDISP